MKAPRRMDVRALAPQALEDVARVDTYGRSVEISRAQLKVFVHGNLVHLNMVREARTCSS